MMSEQNDLTVSQMIQQELKGFKPINAKIYKDFPSFSFSVQVKI